MTAVGCTRVSTQSQNLHPQTDALTAAGASKIFTDKITGKYAERPGLAACLEYRRDNEVDVLFVYSTGRFAPSMNNLVAIAGSCTAGVSSSVRLQSRSTRRPPRMSPTGRQVECPAGGVEQMWVDVELARQG